MSITMITAPLPGIFYRRPSPAEAAFKEPGDAVSAGETIGLIEVMKSFVPVQAIEGGRLVRFLVEDGAPVEADQAVAELE